MKNDRSPLTNLALISQIGISMFVPIFGCFLLGKFIDQKIGHGNTFLIIFTILGVLSAFRNLFVIGMRASRKKDENGTDKF